MQVYPFAQQRSKMFVRLHYQEVMSPLWGITEKRRFRMDDTKRLNVPVGSFPIPT